MNKANNGNALFLILIAVALFAALSYAITQSGRGGGNISREQAAIAASQITQYAASVQSAVQRMIISGTPAHSICYNMPGAGMDCSAPTQYRVFAPEGGGATWQCLNDNLVDDPATMQVGGNYWRYRGIHRIDNNGFYIKDIGTNTDITGRDAIAYLGGVKVASCQQINKGLGLDPTPVDDATFQAPTSGGATYDAGTNTLKAYPGQPFACIGEDGIGTPNNYYHALIEQ